MPPGLSAAIAARMPFSPYNFLLLPVVKATGPGHPLFSVTAKDIVFAFYGFGLIGTRELQTSLEHIAQEEERLFAVRIAKK